MRIEFERSGGFMGLRQMVVLDTNSLDPAEAVEIQKMIEEAGFFNLPEKCTDGNEAPDQFVYRLTIERSKEFRHTVELSETSAPEELQPLLRRLTLMARQRKFSRDASQD